VKSTTRSLRALKGVRPIVCLTAYDVSTARIADAGGADLILVGDSLGNAVLGLPDTVGVTLDMMIHHSAAVVRAKTEALVVGDLPFGLAHDSFPKLLGYCRRFLQEGGVKAVKIEGGASLAPAIARLVDAGIPVMGHVGMLPQRVHSAGYRRRGLTLEDQKKILIDAQAVAAAGAFAMVVECVRRPSPDLKPTCTVTRSRPSAAGPPRCAPRNPNELRHLRSRWLGYRHGDPPRPPRPDRHARAPSRRASPRPRHHA